MGITFDKETIHDALPVSFCAALVAIFGIGEGFAREHLLCSSIRNQNVLIVDDVTTSGATLNEVLRILRILNENNNIVVFSLIGRKDLMADAM